MNKTRNLCALVGILSCGFAVGTRGATVELFEWGVKGDATIYTSSPSLPGYIDASGFDFTDGLGTIKATVGSSGTHYFALYVDHEIDQGINTFFNEYGTPVNTPAPAQSWEIDEPGFVFGDIHQNFINSSLDNKNGVPSTAPDDVAMALSWDFTLGAGDVANIIMQIGESIPSAGFYLTQTDPDSKASIYFSSMIIFTPGGPQGVPEGGSTMGCLALALIGLEGLRRKL